MTKKADAASGAGLPALVVFSHLRWDSPYRRPRELLSRLAARTRVLFVEEPRFHAGDPSATVRVPERNVTVLTPRTPLNAPAEQVNPTSAVPATGATAYGLPTTDQLRAMLTGDAR